MQAIKPNFDSNPRGAINFTEFAALNYQFWLINDPVSRYTSNEQTTILL